MGEIADFQQRVWGNMVNKGFNTSDSFQKLERIRGELDELEEALRSDPEHAPEELADVIIEGLGLAGILGTSAEEQIIHKMGINEKRRYKNIDGKLVKEEK